MSFLLAQPMSIESGSSYRPMSSPWLCAFPSSEDVSPWTSVMTIFYADSQPCLLQRLEETGPERRNQGIHDHDPRLSPDWGSSPAHSHRGPGQMLSENRNCWPGEMVLGPCWDGVLVTSCGGTEYKSPPKSHLRLHSNVVDVWSPFLLYWVALLPVS